MNPHERYELRPGEWREDPPRVSYGADRSGLVKLISAEMSASPWTEGESAAGPHIEVHGRTLACPPTDEDLDWLRRHATPAPYGRGEETLLDREVRDALQIGAEHVKLKGAAAKRLANEILQRVAQDMGLDDAELRLEPLKLLLYEAGGHFAAHADTEKSEGMVASATVVVPGRYEGGTLAIEHAGQTLRFAHGGAQTWRWAAWYADCRHTLEPVRGGIRVSMTFGIGIDTANALGARRAKDDHLVWVFSGRTYADWHTGWAARGARTRAGSEQYGQKTVWVLEHRYSEPGLQANLLKGRDRDLARLILGDPHDEARFLGWLQIRDVGSAETEDGCLWSDEDRRGRARERDEDYEPPPASLVDNDETWYERDLTMRRLQHAPTPQLHLTDVARQNIWIEGLRTLSGDRCEHGPIEVLDGEIVPRGALDDARPRGARVYEATGNEGASLELQYRSAVLVFWRRNHATLEMLARCGGRRAIAVEYTRRNTGKRPRQEAYAIESLIDLWKRAHRTDGGSPDPFAHTLLIQALRTAEEGDITDRVNDALRDRYVERVAAVDLDVEAVSMVIGWITARLESGKAIDPWMRVLRSACAGRWRSDVMSGAPALVRALCGKAATQPLAFEVLRDRFAPPKSVEEVMRTVERLEEKIEEVAWEERSIAKNTADGSAAKKVEG